MNLSDYKFVSREVTVNETIRGKIRDTKVIIICVLDTKTYIVYPHPLTHFIRTQYEFLGKSLNSSDVPSREVCRLLNFCIEKIEEGHEDFIVLKEKGLRGLKRQHASQYITHQTLKGLQKATVEQTDKYLNRFFIYLKDMHLIDEDFLIQKRVTKKGAVGFKSIFKHPILATRYPSQTTRKKRVSKLKDFGEDRLSLTQHFINLTMDIAPEIALGVCFQFYGGLRRGEVVNIGRDGLIVSHGESMEVQIRDNRQKFFFRLKDTKAENPKRLNYLNLEMARQTILDNDLVWKVYDLHMKRLNIMLKNGTSKNATALFLDDDGQPMSGKVYDKRFNKVKKAFLDSIMGHKDYTLISDTVWSTHIGRGVFTNLLIHMGFTPTQLAIARGDRNINSALSYIDETFTNEQLKEAVNELRKHPTEQLGVIDYKEVQRWKKQKAAVI